PLALPMNQNLGFLRACQSYASLQVVPSKTLQEDSPPATFQVLISGGFSPRSSTTKSIMPEIGSLPKCGLAVSLASTAKTFPSADTTMKPFSILTSMIGLKKLLSSAAAGPIQPVQASMTMSITFHC